MKLYKRFILSTVVAAAAFNVGFGAIDGVYFTSEVYNNTDKALVFEYNTSNQCKSKDNKAYAGKVVLNPKEPMQTVLDKIPGGEACDGYLKLVAVKIDGKEIPVVTYSNPNDLEFKFYGEGANVMRGKVDGREFIVNYFSSNRKDVIAVKNQQGVEVNMDHKIFTTTITEQNIITLAAGGIMGLGGHNALNAANFVANTGVAIKELTYDLCGKAKDSAYHYAGKASDWWNKK
ncbi:MAG: hypothetical protein COZ46_05150 [Verrucomicrobia bacterium CG_4_10_14_3_um_filter_43_23]|nr:MAG: hypothetical protein AUJ82_03900 [Verrucomicrobia bacterium CG1_02_43_26]PIP58492.1 MAG: hypothetical protein COX01_08225 [Verrucomicrobia bacterium CG22_combo_CG10-13_8_21_14_all_43_17]PIX58165.1 MAG: hypothetical protein COZ46_05150 [Verrucomicrobia bacterium CG_4_10_14_3_um_filter_43_23]PIY61149.1 MAG: hypothetical protein COY94_06805 [Verrucomicrobia bacterium CG_4_10_14_0_8_um_filter_43_34]PJA43372.1 MAG: hypothetical protein CO175_08375 [Verrucomicrobia bacterium CG_4_9_14_3_um_fi